MSILPIAWFNRLLTECHLGGRAHSRVFLGPGIRPELRDTGSSGIHKLDSDLSRSHRTWQTFQSLARNHRQV